MFQELMDQPTTGSGRVQEADIRQDGSIRVVLEGASKLGTNERAPAGETEHVGDANHLLSAIDGGEPKTAHLALHDPATGTQFVVLSVNHPTERQARDWATKTQATIDRLAELTERGADPFAAIKKFRNR